MTVIPSDALVVVADGGSARLFRNRGTAGRAIRCPSTRSGDRPRLHRRRTHMRCPDSRMRIALRVAGDHAPANAV